MRRWLSITYYSIVAIEVCFIDTRGFEDIYNGLYKCDQYMKRLLKDVKGSKDLVRQIIPEWCKSKNKTVQ